MKLTSIVISLLILSSCSQATEDRIAAFANNHIVDCSRARGADGQQIKDAIARLTSLALQTALSSERDWKAFSDQALSLAETIAKSDGIAVAACALHETVALLRGPSQVQSLVAAVSMTPEEAGGIALALFQNQFAITAISP